MSDLPEDRIWIDTEYKLWCGPRIVKDDPPRDEYRLKSTVDAERAADDKTIRELAAQISKTQKENTLMAYTSEGTEAKRYHAVIAGNLQKLLNNNAPRIAKAQEGK